MEGEAGDGRRRTGIMKLTCQTIRRLNRAAWTVMGVSFVLPALSGSGGADLRIGFPFSFYTIHARGSGEAALSAHLGIPGLLVDILAVYLAFWLIETLCTGLKRQRRGGQYQD